MKKTEKIKLIVADDAPFIREIVKQISQSDTHIELIGEATNGEEAIEMVSALQPDVILMDIVMPKKNGLEAAKEILEHDPKMKIIAFSTLDQEGMLLKALEAGCCDFLAKPFEAADVKTVINKAMAGEA